MSLGIRIFQTGIRLLGQNSVVINTAGELRYNSATNRLQLFDTALRNITTDDGVATLTNKTLTTPVITTVNTGSGTFNFNTSGTITVPNATDTLVGKATTDTLTNKSISGSANTLSNIGDGSLSVSYLKADGTRPLTGNWSAGAFTITANSVQLGSAANTITGLSTIINGSGILTLPTSTDILVGRATTDTLTNKTFSAPLITNFITFPVITTPTIPPVGQFQFYFKSDGQLYYLNSAGTEFQVTTTASAGAGNLNAYFALEGAVIPFEHFGQHVQFGTLSLVNVKLGLVNLGATSSTVTIQLNQYRSGAFLNSATASITVAAGLYATSVSAALTGTLSLLSGDLITADVNSVTGAPEWLTIEY